MSETPNSQGQGTGINPAWKPLLDKLPESFQTLIKDDLANWDKNFQTKLQETRDEYKDWEKFKKANLSPDMVEKSLYLWNEFSNNPQKVISEAIEAYDLPYVDPATIQQDDNDDFDSDDDTMDLSKHPQFQQLMEQFGQVNNKLSEREQADEQAQAAKEFESWLDEQEQTHGEFDRLYVTALMTQGVDGDDAIKRYHDLVGGAVVQQQQATNSQQTVSPPVVMGGDGNTGSGTPDQSIQFGDLSKSEVNDAVVAMLQSQAEQNNQG